MKLFDEIGLSCLVSFYIVERSVIATLHHQWLRSLGSRNIFEPRFYILLRVDINALVLVLEYIALLFGDEIMHRLYFHNEVKFAEETVLFRLKAQIFFIDAYIAQVTVFLLLEHIFAVDNTVNYSWQLISSFLRVICSKEAYLGLVRPVTMLNEGDELHVFELDDLVRPLRIGQIAEHKLSLVWQSI